MQDTISYLDPLSIHNIRDTIEGYIHSPLSQDYREIRMNYSPDNTARELCELVKIKN
jgi:hypothetical protein